MDISEVDLDGGTFKFTIPYHWISWIVWVIGLILTLLGIVATLGGNEIGTLLLSAVGCLMMAFVSPGSLEGQMKKVRENAIDPAELEAKAQASGLTIDSWLMQQSTYVPTNDPNDWILPAPGPSTWDNANPYGAHGDGTAIPEHPSVVGTPRPATMTSFTIFASLSVVFALAGVAGVMASDDTDSIIPAVVVIAIGFIVSLISYFRSKMLSQMLDTPTSLVRSAPVGYPELVGQVRPVADGCLTVVVDGNQNMVMNNMVGYHWSYEQYQCRTVKTDNGTREECNWVTIRSDSGGCPFILHDGTGGIRVNAQTFKRTDYGQYLKRWDGAFAQTLGKQLMAQAVAGLLGGARVKKHRWTLYGLKLGNPVYVLGETKPRTSEAVAAEGLDGTLGNSIIEVWGGEDAPGVKVTLQRGTELSNVASSRSGFEMLMPPLMFMLGGIALLGLA